MKNIFISLGLALGIGSVCTAKDLGFRFRDGKCQDSKGTAGLNPGYIGQCGDLSNTVISRFNFDGTDLSGSTFEGADLQGSTAHGANLTGASFGGANLSGVDLQESFLHQVKFNQAVMVNAHFAGADIKGCDFTQANLSGALLSYVVLTGSNFSSTNLIGATLDHSDLTNTNLGAILNGANLQSAVLDGATLDRGDLTGADLSGASLKGTKGKGVAFRSAILRKANLQGAVLSGSNFRSAQMDNAILNQADLSNSDLRSAVLKGATTLQTQLSGVLINPRTVLPFTLDEATKLGMVMNKGGLVFILWDDMNDDVKALKTFLEMGGADVTLSAQDTSMFDGTESLAGYTAVLHLCGKNKVYQKDMPVKGQQALVTFVTQGGAYVGTQWTGYMVDVLGFLKEMRDLVLITYGSGTIEERTLTPLAEFKFHPLFEKLTAPLKFNCGFTQGEVRAFDSAPAQALMLDEKGKVMAAARTLGAGRAVVYGFSGSYSDGELNPHCLMNASVQQLIFNAVNW